jgi:cytochrome c-type biogenesis protein CcmH
VSGRLPALAVAILAALALVASAAASEERPTLQELENEIICPTCHTTLALSNAPVAERMRGFIRERIAAGDTKSEIKDRLVAEFGEGVLAAPPREGFNLLAWLLPLVGIAIAAVLVGLLVWRWRTAGRGRDAPGGDPSLNGRRPLDPELERRLDEELARFD